MTHGNYYSYLHSKMPLHVGSVVIASVMSHDDAILGVRDLE